jgi:hypothetical protein
MKTTLDLNGRLLADVKVLAARQRTSLTRLIEEGLQLRLRVASAPPVARATRIPVHRGKGGLVRGVDPLSNKAMMQAVITVSRRAQPKALSASRRSIREVKRFGTKAVTTAVAAAVVVEDQLCEAVRSSHDAT